MNALEEANKILIKSKHEIKVLMEKYLSDHEFSEVGKLASLAEMINDIILKLNNEDLIFSNSIKMSSNQVNCMKQGEKTANLNKGKCFIVKDSSNNYIPNRQQVEYPYFRKDKDKLIKIGWNQKNECTYEHRAPLEVIKKVAQEIGKKGELGESFKIENLTPMEDKKGNVIPAYQAYLTVAWLRNIGLVKRKGKNEYICTEKKLSQNFINKLINKVSIKE